MTPSSKRTEKGLQILNPDWTLIKSEGKNFGSETPSKSGFMAKSASLRNGLIAKITGLSTTALSLAIILPSEHSLCMSPGEQRIAQDTTQGQINPEANNQNDRVNKLTSGNQKNQKRAPLKLKTRGARSWDTRKNQSHEVSALYTPASDFLLQYGASLSKTLSPDARFGLTYLAGRKTANYELNNSGARSTAILTGMTAFGYGRFFMGNSFNIMGGLGYRSALIDYKITDPALGLELHGKVNIQSVTIPFFIGNAWTWPGGFTLGVDWLGVLIPIGGRSKASMDGNLSSEQINELNNIFLELGDKLSKTASFTVFLTSIGWAF